MRLAWFSPMPPVPTGIAACSAELVAALRGEHDIDVFRDSAQGAAAPGTLPAHDFVWRHRAAPYDLTVYQVGNSSHHDFLWPYLFRYPGLAVLHDAHLHHARAAALLRTKRAADYRAEFVANHPDAHQDEAELAIRGFDSHLYYLRPMTRLIAQASRLTAVHAPSIAAALAADVPGAAVTAIRLAHGTPVADEAARAARHRIRTVHGLADEDILFGVFGGLTPEKRIPQILEALAAVLPYAPGARLVLAGAPASHYDVRSAIRDRGLDAHVVVTGYVETDAALTDYIAACDVSMNLRWPTAREMSGPWLRALAAGRATITTDLAHLADVPALDARTWRTAQGAGIRDPGCGIRDADPVTVAIDILDEDHSLRLAMRRLATDRALRESLGAAGRRYWDLEHSMPRMLEDYRRAVRDATQRPAPEVPLPAHLVTNGDRRLNEILREFALPPVWT